MSSPAANESKPATISEKPDGVQDKLEPSKDIEEPDLGKKEMLTYRQPPWYDALRSLEP